MNILITGGSGYLGRALTDSLLTNSVVDKLHWVSRTKDIQRPVGVEVITYEEFVQSTTVYDVLINLAGAGIADARWSDSRKQLLINSRLQPTQAVLDYLSHIEKIKNQQTNDTKANKPKLFISGSAIGWYGAQAKGDTTPLTESNQPVKEDFSHHLCAKWEALAMTAIESSNIQLAIVRTGVVLSGDVTHGGMIARLKLPFLMGAGGRLADGRQLMSWISRTDWVRAVEFIIEHNIKPNLTQSLINKTMQDKGDSVSTAKTLADELAERTIKLPQVQVYNLTAPTAVSNSDFTTAVGSWLKRPTVMTQPPFVLKTLFGEMATLLIDGQNIVPERLLAMGFEFTQLTVSQALNS